MAKYIGLMSGTSLDGIDAALVDLSDEATLIQTHTEKLPENLRMQLASFHEPTHDELNRMGNLDHQLGKYFAKASLAIIEKAGLTPQDIHAIGSHGQTIRHAPYSEHPFTIQIGDPNHIAAITGITTVADFRRRDMAVGGQGAPFAPAFHDAFFRDENNTRVIVNIGGIANITRLAPGEPVIGYDTGPGNALLDAWCERHTGKSFDHAGDWARSGRVNQGLLQRMMSTPYFSKTPPKSTGREVFHLNWLTQHMKGMSIQAEDVQASLLQLTAQTIADTIGISDEILICGGGVHNVFLMEQLNQLCDGKIKSTAHYGIDPDWIEAMAFAWFAKQTLHHQPGNLPSVTGALRPVILGGVYY